MLLQTTPQLNDTPQFENPFKITPISIVHPNSSKSFKMNPQLDFVPQFFDFVQENIPRLKFSSQFFKIPIQLFPNYIFLSLKTASRVTPQVPNILPEWLPTQCCSLILQTPSNITPQHICIHQFFIILCKLLSAQSYSPNLSLLSKMIHKFILFPNSSKLGWFWKGFWRLGEYT